MTSTEMDMLPGRSEIQEASTKKWTIENWSQRSGRSQDLDFTQDMRKKIAIGEANNKGIQSGAALGVLPLSVIALLYTPARLTPSIVSFIPPQIREVASAANREISMDEKIDFSDREMSKPVSTKESKFLTPISQVHAKLNEIQKYFQRESPELINSLRAAISDAYKMIGLLPRGISPSQISAAEDGEIIFEWFLDGRHLIVGFEGDGEFGYTMLDNKHFVPGREKGNFGGPLPKDMLDYLG